MKNIFIGIAIIFFLVGCNKDNELSKKVPGWYSYEQVVNNVKISGKMTYYKNGALQINAKVNTAVLQNINIGISLKASGTWKVKDGYLVEDIISCNSTPQFIGDALLAKYREKAQSSNMDKIIDVNNQELRLKNANGEILIYKRLPQ